MYAGMSWRSPPADDLFAIRGTRTRSACLQSVPRLHAPRRAKLRPIEGSPRDMLNPPRACPFQPRCRYKSTCRAGGAAARRDLARRPLGRLPSIPSRRMNGNWNYGNLVELEDLRVWFPIRSGIVSDRTRLRRSRVDGVSLRSGAARRSVLVGESAAASPTVGRAILRLSRNRPAAGSSSTARTSPNLSRALLRPLRRRMQMVFQDPFASLNPRHSVGRHRRRAAARARPGRRRRRREARRELNPRCVGRACRTRVSLSHEFSGGPSASSDVLPARSRSTDFTSSRQPSRRSTSRAGHRSSNLLEELQEDFRSRTCSSRTIGRRLRHISTGSVMYLGTIVEVSPATICT